jgi:hypothetical protein
MIQPAFGPQCSEPLNRDTSVALHHRCFRLRDWRSARVLGRAPHVEPGESSASDWQQGELTAALQIGFISDAQTELATRLAAERLDAKATGNSLIGILDDQKLVAAVRAMTAASP